MHSESMGQILHLAAKARRQEINAAVYQGLQGRIAAGPFAGMLLPDQTSWLDGDIAPKLLGFYESELHSCLSAIATAGYPIVLNIGCADGYYAIGLARLMPQSTIYAFDISEEAQRVCRDAAARNGVADRIVVGGRCDTATLNDLLPQAGKAFLLLDCEGGEKELLDPDQVPALRHCDFAAECHDFFDRSITPTIQQRFSRTHDVATIQEGARDPNGLPMLRSLSSLDRWLTVCEFRPQTMHWLVGTAR